MTPRPTGTLGKPSRLSFPLKVYDKLLSNWVSQLLKRKGVSSRFCSPAFGAKAEGCVFPREERRQSFMH
ncbi:hypothetical protein BDZ97DRAFT_1840637 [Flammula alnicola]|nr:hypothetical protein BDZ97DRAFT_1840637 [Flammula alnicola]